MLGLNLLAFVAFGFTAFSSHCLVRRFDDDDRRWRWLIGFFASSIIALLFWGWAWSGHPLLAWRISAGF